MLFWNTVFTPGELKTTIENSSIAKSASSVYKWSVHACSPCTMELIMNGEWSCLTADIRADAMSFIHDNAAYLRK